MSLSVQEILAREVERKESYFADESDEESEEEEEEDTKPPIHWIGEFLVKINHSYNQLSLNS